MQPGLPLPLLPAMLPLDGHPDLFLTAGSAPPTRAVLGCARPPPPPQPGCRSSTGPGPTPSTLPGGITGRPPAHSPGPPLLLSSPDTMWGGPRSTLVRAPRWTFAASSQGEEMEARRSNGRFRSARPQDQGSKLHPCLEPPAISRLPQPQAPGSEARTNHGLPAGSPVALHQPALVPGRDGPEGTPHLYVTSPRVFETLQNVLDSWLPATKIRTKF